MAAVQEPMLWGEMDEGAQSETMAWFQEVMKDSPIASRARLVATKVICVIPGMVVSGAGGSDGAGASSSAGAAGSSSSSKGGEGVAGAVVRAEAFVTLQGIVSTDEKDAQEAVVDALESRVADIEIEMDMVLAPGTELPGAEVSVAHVAGMDGIHAGAQVVFGDVVGASEDVVSLITFVSASSPPALGMVHGLVGFARAKHESWGGRVRVVCVWLDDAFSPAHLAEQLTTNGWDVPSVVHVCGGDGGIWSEIAGAFSVTQIPVCFLSNTAGEVVWQGMGGTLDFEVEIDGLLAGSTELMDKWKASFADATVSVPATDGESEEAGGCCGGCGSDDNLCVIPEKHEGKWLDAATDDATRQEKLSQVFRVARDAGLAFDSFISQHVTMVTGDKMGYDARISVAGEFPATMAPQLKTTLAAMQDAAGAAIDISSLQVYSTAREVTAADTCSACGKAAASPDTPDEPALVCVHSDEPLTLCSQCFWTTDYDPTHMFVTSIPGRTDMAFLRHGGGTLEPENPADTNDVNDGMHVTVQCDGCGINPLALVRYKCAHCADYDLCADCFAAWANNDGVVSSEDGMTYSHPRTHAFLALRADRTTPAAANV